jgi:very-short-patch-repair endonuclease
MPNKLIPYKNTLKHLARNLRNGSTLSEVLLWKQIKGRSLGVQFHRQVPIDNFIIDLYCHEIKLAIEIDGSSHNNEQVYKNDIERQERLDGLGVHFIRFNDLSVKKDMANVILALQNEIERLTIEKRNSFRRGASS